MLSESPRTLLDGYSAALKNPDKMRGWKSALTRYCERRSQEMGRPSYRFRAGVKMTLTKSGYDVSGI